MNEKRKEIPDKYLNSINELYQNIDIWLSSSDLATSQEKIEITEEASGKYNAHKLIIKDVKKDTVASIVPVGAWVIGANGRVDLIGKYDIVIIINLEKGEPLLTTEITVGDHQETSSTKFYKGINETGWYWIEDRRRGKAHLLNKELFHELLSEVSDYEFK